jgi:hypothetical protein
MTGWYEEHEYDLFPEFSGGELLRDVENFVYGSGRLHKTLGYFFDRLMYQYARRDSKHTPMEILESEELLERLWLRVDSKPRMFPEGRGSVASFRTAVSVGASSICKCLSNFPAVEASKIYQKYCNALNGPVLVFDPSAGFGSRMAAALLGGFDYVATDPNKDLCKIFPKFKSFLVDTGFVRGDQRCDIFCQGSEVFIPELEGKVDFAFTSPPYFNLEKYSDDDAASTKNYGNFRLWGKEYVAPTIFNIRSYLKVGGCVGINIKNLPGLPLYDVWRRVFQAVGGFEELEPHQISISRRQYGKGKGGTLDERLVNYYGYSSYENMMVFKRVI